MKNVGDGDRGGIARRRARIARNARSRGISEALRARGVTISVERWGKRKTRAGLETHPVAFAGER